MATTPKTLDQEWLDQLVAMLAQPAYQGQGMQGPDGKWWQPLYDTSGYSGAEGGGGFQGGAPIGWLNSWDIGDKLSQQDRYDPNGKFLDTKIHKENPAWKDHLGGLAFLGGTAMGLNSVFGGGLGGLGNFGAMDLGAGVPSGVPRWDAAFTQAGGSWAPGFAAPAGMGGPTADSFGDILGFADDPAAAYGGGGNPLSKIDFNLSFADPAAPNFGYDPFATLGTDVGAGGFGGLGSNTLVGMGGMADVGGLGGAFGGLSGLGGGSGGGFWDKLATNTTDFLSSPANLLKTVATIGALTEGGGDGSVTQTKTLPPELQGLLSGPNGLYGQLQNWMTANPGGQNQTMRDAQTGMRNFLLDPNVMGSIYKQGFAGQGLLSTPVAKNPWGA